MSLLQSTSRQVHESPRDSYFMNCRSPTSTTTPTRIAPKTHAPPKFSQRDSLASRPPQSLLASRPPQSLLAPRLFRKPACSRLPPRLFTRPTHSGALYSLVSLSTTSSLQPGLYHLVSTAWSLWPGLDSLSRLPTGLADSEALSEDCQL